MTFAKLAYDKTKGFSYLKNTKETGIPTDCAQWWKVSLSLISALLHRISKFDDTALQSHADEYPNGLARVAMDYLSIPAATVDIEREFSIAGEVFTKKRNRINGDTARAQMCLKSWIGKGLWDPVEFWAKQNVRK